MQSLSSLTLPPSYPRSAHHHLPVLIPDSASHHRSLSWAYRFGLLPDSKAMLKAAKIRVDTLALITYPTADPLALQLCTDLLMWFFLIDDQFDERLLGHSFVQMSDTCERLLAVLATGSAQGERSPFALALLDLRQRLVAELPDAWLDRFVASMQRYLHGCVIEAMNRQLGVTPSVADYRDIRRASVGTYPCFDVIELTISRPLSTALASQPQLVALRDVASDVIAWVNDLVSLRKESAYRDPHNLVAVLMAEKGLAQAAAIDQTQQLIAEQLQTFVQLVSALRQSDQDPLIWEYLGGIASWIAGVQCWSYQSERYGEDYLQLSRSAKHQLILRRPAQAAQLTT